MECCEKRCFDVASLVAPCASPLLLLWSVLVAPEIPADPSMTKWLDPTLKTPFPGDLYISTLTWPPPQCELQSPFLAPEKWQEMSANPKAADFKDSPKKETPRIPTKDISRVSQGKTTPPCWFAAAASGSPGCTWRFTILGKGLKFVLGCVWRLPNFRAAEVLFPGFLGTSSLSSASVAASSAWPQEIPTPPPPRMLFYFVSKVAEKSWIQTVLW